jgi:putative CocE/NonD family hydrolase
MPRSVVLPLSLLLFPLAAPLPAQDDAKTLKEYVLSHYTKYEYAIPMRDGTKLATVVYLPKDTSKTYPMLMHRTPYGVGPYGVDDYTDSNSRKSHYLKAGYILVNQDVRGRMKSEGKFVDMRPHNPTKKDKEFDESSDCYDTIEWLLKNVPGHNGRVGLQGVSYPGFYAACGMIDAHPALKAVSPQAPVIDMYDGDDWRHNGAMLILNNFAFEQAFNKMTPRIYRDRTPFGHDFGTHDYYKYFLELGPLSNADEKFFKGVSATWDWVKKHPDYDDYCSRRNLRPHLRNIKPAVLTVGGWYDAEDLAGTLYCYKQVAKASPECPQNVLVMGPWTHGGWEGGDGDSLGPIKFNSKTGDFYRKEVEFPFFEQHLKDAKPANLPKAALVFETGTNRWRRFDTWPPRESEAVKLHLGPNGALSRTPAKEGHGEYVSDPLKPVPYTEGNEANGRYDNKYMVADQRHASRRPDVLVYQTPVLTEDMNVNGPVEVELHVSTTGTDADFVVKLIDVYPDDFPDTEVNGKNVRLEGYQRLIRGEPFRGKYRNSLAKPEPFEPGKPTVIKFTMPDVSHSFRTGHRVMVQVQSTWFPFFDRNPQTFCNIYEATDKDFIKATHKVYHSEAMPSGITVRVAK